MEWGALGALASQAGPWIFCCVVIVLLQRHWAGVAVRSAEQRTMDWKEIAITQQKTLDVRDAQLREMLDGYRTFESVLRSIERTAQERERTERIPRLPGGVPGEEAA